MNINISVECEGKPLQKVTSWEVVEQLFSQIHPYKLSYIIIVLPNSNYMQCAGGNASLTVEARVYQENTTFIHYTFGIGELTGQTKRIDCNVGPIFVDKSQVLNINQALPLLKQFAENGTFCDTYVATNTTYYFVS